MVVRSLAKSAQNQDRPDEVARHRTRRRSRRSARTPANGWPGWQLAGDERAPYGRGAARDLDHEHDERDHGDRIAQERGALADPQSQEASVL